jgi:hypothetical protein
MAAARDQRPAARAARRAAAFLAALLVLAPAVIAGSAVAAPEATAPPMAVSVIVPMTARAGDNGMLDAEALSIATSPAGNLTRELDEVLATSATIALDPMILASIRALGSAAPESALDWLDRLEAASNEVFLLAYADADLSALVRAEATDLAAPSGFGFALDPGAFGPAVSPTPTPTSTATPEPTDSPDPGDDVPPPLPTTDELLAWPGAVGRIAWPSDGSVVRSDLPAYAAAGYDAVLMNSGNVSETASGLADAGDIRAVIADSAASDLFQSASTSIDEPTRQDAHARLGTALDGLAAAHPGRSLVLTLDRAPSFSAFGLKETYAAIVASASTQVVGLSAVLGGTAEGASIVERAPAAHVETAPTLVAAARAEEAFATILDDPLALTAPRRLQLLALLAVQDTAAVDWSERADAFLERSTDILGAVTIADTSDLLVTSTQTSIPIKIANALDFAVTVRVAATPVRPLLRIDSPTDVTVEPGSSRTVRLDAQAITNGEVIVEVSLSNPVTGAAIGRPSRFAADLHAEWETVGLIVGALVALVFAAGIVRNVIVRRRRSAKADDEDARADG